MANHTPRKKRDWKRQNACEAVIIDRLDLDNGFWIFAADDDAEEREKLLKLAEMIGRIMGQNSNIKIKGETISADEYWNRVKNLEYTPELMRACKRYGMFPDFGKYPWKTVIDSPLMQAIYFIAPEKENENPRKKFSMDYVEWVEAKCPPIEVYAQPPRRGASHRQQRAAQDGDGPRISTEGGR